MIYLVFAREESPFPHHYPWMDKWCGMMGAMPVVVDLTGQWEETTDQGAPLIFTSYPDAVDHLRGLVTQFIWLDHRADITLSQLHHPKDNVAYVIGSDTEGFQGCKTAGWHVRIPVEGEFHAAMILPWVVAGRMLGD